MGDGEETRGQLGQQPVDRSIVVGRVIFECSSKSSQQSRSPINLAKFFILRWLHWSRLSHLRAQVYLQRKKLVSMVIHRRIEQGEKQRQTHVEFYLSLYARPSPDSGIPFGVENSSINYSWHATQFLPNWRHLEHHRWLNDKSWQSGCFAL